MGLVFEELIRKFAEISNETAGEHFTPREVIRLMVNLLFIEDNDALTKPGVVRTMYDPTAGTGGMLSVAGEYLYELNPKARLTLFGQELNPESLRHLQGRHADPRPGHRQHRARQHAVSDDGLLGKLFDYMLSNPPFGVEWKKIEKAIRDEYEKQGYSGRFGPGLPRVSDGSLLFLLHLLSKMRPAEAGRQPHRHRAERLAAVHRRRRLGRIGDPPLRAGERPGRGHRRAADRHVLQHRHRHLRLDPDQPQARRPQGPACS